MKRFAYLLIVAMTSTSVFAQGNPSAADKMKLREDVIEQDQIDDSDTLAIPFDDSATEDEEMLDRMERKPYAPEVPTKSDPIKK